MTRDLFKDFLREIRKSLNRFLSILCIVAIGTAFFVGLKSSAPDMSYTMDHYYDEYNTMDLDILSTLGLTDEDIQAISEIDGVSQVQAGYFTDAITFVNGSELIFRLHSLPESYDDTTINQIKLVEGRMPESPNEIVIETNPTLEAGVGSINIGDILTFKSGTETALTDGTMYEDSFTVVGKAITPYYLTYDKGTSQIGGKAITFFGYVQEAVFDYSGIYTEALVTVSGAKELNAFTAKYRKLVEEVSVAISNIGVDRSKARGDSLKEQAYEQLDEAQAEYDKQLAEMEKAHDELIEGEKELAVEREKYELEIKYAEEKIAEGEEELAEAAKLIAEGKKAVEEGQKQYDAALKEFNAAMEQNSKYLEQLNSLEESLADLEVKMAETKKQLEDAKNNPDATEEEIAMYQQLYDTYVGMYDVINGTYQEVKTMNSGLNTLIDAVKESLSQAEQELESAKKELADATSQYNDGLAQLNSAKAELAAKKAEAEAQFAEAQEKIDEGWEEYNAGKEQLDDAYLQLIDAKYQIDLMENAVWYVLDRSMNYGFASYQSTVDRMSALSQILPVFFIIVAVLVCMTTMNRMVTEQRTIIGTYKALGYGDNAIASKYVMYVASASLVGAIVGAALGAALFPRAVYNAWEAMYSQPEFMQTVHYGIIAASLVISIAAMIATAYYTCYVELKTVPSQLMRPKAPKAGKTILLERIPFIWSHLNFSQKVTARNIFRYKKRLFMTIIGIMGCTALLLAGLGINDTISTVVENQFEKVFKYDVSAEMKDGLTDAEKTEIEDELKGRSEIEGMCLAGTTSFTMSNENVNVTASAYVVEDTEGFGDYVLLANRNSGKKLELSEDGVVLSEKLAEQLGVSVGDSVDITNSSNITKKITVTGITENYVFHYVYMSQTCYQSYFWYPVAQNSILLKLADGIDSAQAEVLRADIENMEGIDSLRSFTEVAEDFEDQISALKSIIILIIICAALLAFVVLYNLTNINISERIKEIATIKVLGFKGNEVAMYVYRENFLLTLMGAILGLFLGVGLHRIIIKSIEQSNVMFGFHISPVSFVESVALTCVFSILVMLYMYRKLTNIPMVESLKAIE